MLPYITSTNLYIGGLLKQEDQDFQVEEIPLYLPSGEGQHIYLLLRRRSLTTKEVVSNLQKLFEIHETDIGFAGLKDRNAVTTQWFSLSLGANAKIEEVKEKIKLNLEALEILDASKHTNKLKTAHLVGNKFKIVVKNVEKNSFSIAKKIRDEVLGSGIPNYYGPQRFGSKKDNHIIGKQILLKQKKEKRRWVKKLMLSAYQSHLFNTWLSNRILSKKFNSIIKGDLLQTITGQRPFPYDEDKEHLKEFKEQIISYTGPIYGPKVSTPTDDALESEEKILETEEVNIEDFKNSKLPGARRLAHIYLNDINIEEVNEGLEFSFTLNKGSYATSLMREFMKTDF
jgi:tRNA pseudouridine13 synthase